MPRIARRGTWAQVCNLALLQPPPATSRCVSVYPSAPHPAGWPNAMSRTTRDQIDAGPLRERAPVHVNPAAPVPLIALPTPSGQGRMVVRRTLTGVPGGMRKHRNRTSQEVQTPALLDALSHGPRVRPPTGGRRHVVASSTTNADDRYGGLSTAVPPKGSMSPHQCAEKRAMKAGGARLTGPPAHCRTMEEAARQGRCARLAVRRARQTNPHSPLEGLVMLHNRNADGGP